MKDLNVIQSAFDDFVNAWFKLSEVLNNIQNDTDFPFLSFYSAILFLRAGSETVHSATESNP